MRDNIWGCTLSRVPIDGLSPEQYEEYIHYDWPDSSSAVVATAGLPNANKPGIVKYLGGTADERSEE